GSPVVAGLIVGAHEPHERVIEPGLVHVEHGEGDSAGRTGAPIGDMRVGPARLVQVLQPSRDVGQGDLREAIARDPSSGLEYAEDVPGGRRFPPGQRQQPWNYSVLRERALRIGQWRPLDSGRLATAGV